MHRMGMVGWSEKAAHRVGHPHAVVVAEVEMLCIEHLIERVCRVAEIGAALRAEQGRARKGAIAVRLCDRHADWHCTDSASGNVV